MSKKNAAVLALVLCVISLFTTACSSNNIQGDPTQFVGQWTFTDGTAQATCVGMRASQDLVGIDVEITQAENGDLLFTTGMCQMHLHLQGSRAVAPGGQLCSLTINGITATSRPASWVVEVRPEGGLRATASGTASITAEPAMPGVPLPCSQFDIAGTLTRTSGS